MGQLVDGEYQKLVVSSGAYVRETFLWATIRALLKACGTAAG